MAPPRRTVPILAAVVAAALLAAIWLAPAAFVDSRLAQASGFRVRLSDATGTLWRAQAVLVAGPARLPIAWRVDPWPLLRGELRVRIMPDATDASAGPPRADLTIIGERILLREVDIALPASIFAADGPSEAAAAWVASGDIRVTVAALDWGPIASRGEARLQWSGARVGVAGLAAALDLGDVTAALTANGDRLSGPVANEGGDLAIRGHITFGAREGTGLSLVLTPRRDDNAQLAQALSAIGIAEGAGWRVDWRLPPR